MDRAETDAIRRHFQRIVEGVSFSTVRDYLIQVSLMSEDTAQDIASERTDSERMRRTLCIVLQSPRRGAFDLFMAALQQDPTCCPLVADIRAEKAARLV